MTPLRWNWSANNPWLTETGSHQQLTPTRSRYGSDGCFERALAPGVPRIVARHLAE
jgi:hypothetical protein